ncbi:MAG: helix-turn-helix transcriptional regulator [Ruminococcaceae bacterium]|jgi:transcriptional regulator with XRE-family HTH domain|nr:helix-turn-helix transcriptional regulator [Oscillospiraceae bacterium]
MELALAENIRRSRKERQMTQEQLAEVLGVTAGAVYKWEAGLSVPELELIVEMADFFDTSVDILLGYEMKDNRLSATVQRLRELLRRKDPAGLAEAEKALKKYPNLFDVVHACAVMYWIFGMERADKALYRRALTLLEESRVLLPQNTDPEISELTICGETAEVYLGLGETEKAVAILKEHNAGGIYNEKIGGILANSEAPEEALPFLSVALARVVAVSIRTAQGFFNVYRKQGDYVSAGAVIQWCTELLSGLKDGDKPNFTDKAVCAALVCLALSQLKTGREEEARSMLQRAVELAKRFDAAPSYAVGEIRFASCVDGASAHDDLGSTAAEGVEKTVRAIDDEALSILWSKLKGELDS